MSEPLAQAHAPGRFSIKTVVALILVGVFSLSALSVLSAYAPELRSGDDGGGHALSRSAIGFGGAVKLLQLSGDQVLLSRGPLHASADDGLLILTPGPQHDHTAVDAVHHEGARLIVLPKWGAVPLADHKGWVQVAGLYPAEAVIQPIQPEDEKKKVVLSRRPGVTHPHLREDEGDAFGVAGPIDQLQTVSGPDLTPLIVDESGGAVLAMNEETGDYILADPDLLNTHGLRTAQSAELAVNMIHYLGEGGPVIFDLTLPGFSRPRSLARLMFEPPMLGATLALLAAAALVAFQASVRFGPGRHLARAIALGKRALADNTAGLVRLAGREHRMGGPYALMIRANVARSIGAPRNLDGEALDAFLDRLGQNLKVHDRYTDLAREAQAAKSPGDLIKVARNLHRWKLEMTRGRQ